MFRSILRRHAAVAALSLAFPAFPALAQEAASTEGDEQAHEVEAVTVVGVRRRVDNLQDVPQSATVLSREQVRDARVTTVEQLQAFVPNFRVSSSGGRAGKGSISIRGLSNTDFSKDPAVGVFVDDVPLSDLSTYGTVLFDVQNLEVLRGPQSTLYGANTPAGVINVITRQPSDSFESEGEIEVGEGGLFLMRGLVSGPLTDTVAASLALVHETSDGHIINRHDGSNFDERQTQAARLKLRWTPNDRWDLNLLLQYAEIDDTGGPFHYVPLDPEAYAAVVPNAPLLGEREVWHNRTDGRVGGDEWIGSIRAFYSGERFQFASITSHRRRTEGFSNWDTDDSAAPVDIGPMRGLPPGMMLIPGVVGYYDGEYQQTTQEFRFQSPAHADERFVWLTGLYFSTSEENGLGGAVVEALGTPLLGAAPNHEQTSQAAFGQATWRFMDNRLGLTAGLRYEQVDREASNPLIPGNEGSDSFDQWLPRLGVDYRLTPDFMVYLDLARGWKAGGFAVETPAGLPFRFEPEIVTNAEIGLKSTLAGGRANVNVAAFQTDVDDYQDTVRLSSLIRYLSNAEAVRNRGVEIEAQWRPSRALELGATFGYVDARYRRYANLDGTRFDGNRVVLVPETSLGVNATYRMDNGFYARADATRYSDFFFDRENLNRQDGYTMVNAKVGFRRENWELYAYGENLAEAEFYERTFPGTLYTNLMFGSPEAPRRFGLGLRVVY